MVSVTFSSSKNLSTSQIKAPSLTFNWKSTFPRAPNGASIYFKNPSKEIKLRKKVQMSTPSEDPVEAAVAKNNEEEKLCEVSVRPFWCVDVSSTLPGVEMVTVE